MDKIWYRNPSKSKVISRCGGMKNMNDHADPTKSRMLKKLSRVVKSSSSYFSTVYIPLPDIHTYVSTLFRQIVESSCVGPSSSGQYVCDSPDIYCLPPRLSYYIVYVSIRLVLYYDIGFMLVLGWFFTMILVLC